MAQNGYPFDGLNTSESDYSYFFRELQDTGVIGEGDLLVTADSSGLNVKVAPGQAVVRGHFYRSTATETLAIATGGSSPRIDSVVLRLDPTANTISLLVLPGTPAASPVPPTRTQSDTDIYDLPLADIAVGVNATTIAAANVTTVRRRAGSRVGRWARTNLRPVSPRRSNLGLNDETNRWEWYDGSAWNDLLSWSTITGRPTTSTIDGRNIFVSDNAPTNAQGADGDLWFEF